MHSASETRRAIVSLLWSIVFLGLLLPGCGLFGPKTNSQPDYAGIWVDKNRTAFAGRSRITVDFYLVLTENRASIWEHAQEGETGCRTSGADVLSYDAQANKLIVAPDSGEARIKHYVERQGDQIIFSQRYIFYTLGRSDTLNLTTTNPAEIEACKGKGE